MLAKFVPELTYSDARLHPVDYYWYIFSATRGSSHAAIPKAVYVVYVVYLLTTAQLSLSLRRLLAGRR